MYKYEGSLTLKAREGSIFSTPNLSNEKVSTIYSGYYKTYLVLSNPAVEGLLYLDMADMKVQLAAYTGTVKSWLELNGDNTLPVSSEKPNINVRYARYSELSRAGYSVSLANNGLHYQKDADRAMFNDVKVERIDTDMEFVNEHSLMTVNGFVHQSTANASGLYIKDAHISAKRANCFTTGMVTFAAIGKLKRYNLSEDNIRPFEKDSTLIEKTLITIPDLDLNKPFFMVLGGYLVFQDPRVLSRVDEKSFILDFNNLDIVERLLESSKFIDLSPLGLEQPNNMHLEGWFTRDLLSDVVLKRYMMLSQSFFVTLDAPNLNVVRVPRINESYPCRYLSVHEPVDPLVAGYGRLLEYWPIKTTIGWEQNTLENFARQFAYSASGPNRHNQVDRSEDPRFRHNLSPASQLEIFSSI